GLVWVANKLVSADVKPDPIHYPFAWAVLDAIADGTMRHGPRHSVRTSAVVCDRQGYINELQRRRIEDLIHNRLHHMRTVLRPNTYAYIPIQPFHMPFKLLTPTHVPCIETRV